MEGQRALEWASDEEREKAIATNEIWELHWYPDTPVGFCSVFASSFGALVAWLEREKLALDAVTEKPE